MISTCIDKAPCLTTTSIIPHLHRKVKGYFFNQKSRLSHIPTTSGITSKKQTTIQAGRRRTAQGDPRRRGTKAPNEGLPHSRSEAQRGTGGPRPTIPYVVIYFSSAPRPASVYASLWMLPSGNEETGLIPHAFFGVFIVSALFCVSWFSEKRKGEKKSCGLAQSRTRSSSGTHRKGERSGSSYPPALVRL